MIKRYGVNEGLIHWNQYVERERYTCTLPYYIEKYGEEIGKEKYDILINKRNPANRLFGPSAISLEMFNKLIKKFKNNIIYYDDNEFKVKTLKYNLYYVDYYDETLNIVIEFYGNYFHLNPEKYSPDFIQYKNHEKCVKAKDKW